MQNEKLIGHFWLLPLPLYQNESTCETFHMKMSSACSFISFNANQTHFHKNGFALRLVLKQRHKETRKLPVALVSNVIIWSNEIEIHFRLQWLRMTRYIRSNYISEFVYSAGNTNTWKLRVDHVIEKQYQNPCSCQQNCTGHGPTQQVIAVPMIFIKLQR